MAIYRRVVTGVSTIIFLVKKLCALQARYGAKILAWAQANMSSGDYVIFLAWYNQFSLVCQILEATPDD